MRTLFILVFLLFSLFLKAQIYSLEFKNITIYEGLSHNTVRCIQKDKNGFMWFGTYDGLNRFDGINFKTYKKIPNDSLTLCNNHISSLFCDTSGKLWVGTRKGLNLFHPDTDNFEELYLWDEQKAKRVLVSTEIQHIIEDGNGEILVATSGQGILRWDGKRRLFIQLPLLIANKRSYDYYSSAMVVGAKNSLFASILQSGFVFLGEDGAFHLLNQELKSIKTLCQSDSSIYIGDDDAVWTYSLMNHEISRLYPQRSGEKCIIHSICRDHNGVLWIGTEERGIILYDEVNGFQEIAAGHDRTSLSSTGIYHIYQDNDHLIWAGTMRGGIQMFDSNKSFFTSRKNNKTLSPAENFINAFAELSRQELLVGTDGQGVYLYNPEKDIFPDLPEYLQAINKIAKNIVSLEKSNNGDIWVGTYGNGLIHYDYKEKKIYHYTTQNSALESDFIWSLCEDRYRNIWIGTVSNGGLYRYNMERKQIESVNLNVSNGVVCLKETSMGELIIGTYESMIIYEPIKQKSVKYNIGWPVRAAWEDEEKNIFIGTEGHGLLKLDAFRKEIIEMAYPKKDIINPNILSIQSDSKGNVWFSTYNGLYAYHPTTGTAYSFTKENGLQSDQFNYSAGVKTSKGQIFFGGINGFTFFNSKNEYRLNQKYSMHIIDIKVLNKSIAEHQYMPDNKNVNILDIKELTLPYEKAYFSIDYIAIAYQNPREITYAYYMEGIDKTWNLAGNNLRATYSQLKEGTYRFYVKGLDRTGNVITQIRFIDITILPPWYRHWLAYILYIVLIVVITYVVVCQFRRQNLLKQNLILANIREQHDKEITLMKEQFFINISHELRTPLTLIISPLTDFLAQSDYIAPKREQLSNIYRNAQRLLVLINQLLLFRKDEVSRNKLLVSENDFVSFVQAIYDNLGQIASQRRIEYSFKSNESAIPLFFDKEKMEIILYNLLSNAFKYTPNQGQIDIVIEKKGEEYVHLIISDTGCGMSQETLDHLFQRFYSSGKKTGIGIGLYLVKKFVELHHGKVEIESQPGKGSSFILTFNLRQQYAADEILQEETNVLENVISGNSMHHSWGYESDCLHYESSDEDISLNESDKNIPKILVVEDNDEIRWYIRECLSSCNNYEIKEAVNGKEALKVVNRFLPDIIISDIIMDKMDGLELCKQIKQNEETNHIYMILITADLSETTEHKGMEYGADEFLTKPFNRVKLLNKIATIAKYKERAMKYFSNRTVLSSEPSEVSNVNTVFIDKCISLIRQKYNDDSFTAVQFAIDMHMSQSALYKKIKLCTNKSLNEFIRTIKLTIAAELLLKGELNINEIATELGFSDIKYFREIFKKQFGVLPSEYQSSKHLPE